MNRGNHTTGAPTRADQLRAAAEQAEQLAALATLADAQLKRASNDLATLASAAKRLAEQIERLADGEAVRL
jgi:hypothetical protein